MGQTERADEAKARSLIEELLEIELQFSDHHGGVDYRFERHGKSGSLEVSRLTDEGLKESSKAWAENNQSFETPVLRNSWIVTTDGHPRYRDTRSALVDALQNLEFHGLQEFDEHRMSWWLVHVPSLQSALENFKRAQVTAAKHLILKSHLVSTEKSEVHLTPFSFWCSAGPDESLAEIENYLDSAQCSDNFRKLGATETQEQHLWLWLDHETPGIIRDPVHEVGPYPSLPMRPPSLPDHVTSLWIVDEPTLKGWSWSRDRSWERRDFK